MFLRVHMFRFEFEFRVLRKNYDSFSGMASAIWKEDILGCRAPCVIGDEQPYNWT
jgi:hypothetical protein